MNTIPPSHNTLIKGQTCSPFLRLDDDVFAKMSFWYLIFSRKFSSDFSGKTSLYLSSMTSSGFSQSILNFLCILKTSRFYLRFRIFFCSFFGSSSKSTRSFGPSSSLFFLFASILSCFFFSFLAKRANISASISSLVFLPDFFGSPSTSCVFGLDFSAWSFWVVRLLAVLVPPPSPKSRKKPASFYWSYCYFSSLFSRLVFMIYCQLLVAIWITFLGFLLFLFTSSLLLIC